MLTSVYEAFSKSMREFAQQMQGAGIKAHELPAFEDSQFKRATLSEIQKTGIRIVILLAWNEDVHVIAQSAEQKVMTTGWGWIVPITDVAIEPMQGWIYVPPFLPSEGMQAFSQQVSDYTQSRFNISLPAESVDRTYSVALHDAVMLYAHAATKVLAEGGDVHDGNVVTEAVRSTIIQGVDGRAVALDNNGDRIQSYEVVSYVQNENHGGMRSVRIGVYNSTIHQYSAHPEVVWWPGSTMVVPVDYSSGASGFALGFVPAGRRCARWLPCMVSAKPSQGIVSSSSADNPSSEPSRAW